MTFDPAQLQVEGEEKPVADMAHEPATKDEFGPGHTQFITNAPGDPDLAVPKGERAKYEAAFGRFCAIFPDMFYMQERGRNYFDRTKDRGRYLSAGFHNLMGYFRDDQPLYELILDAAGREQLDEMWHELDFVAHANTRTFVQFDRMGGRGERATGGTNDLDDSMADEKVLTRRRASAKWRLSTWAWRRAATPRGLRRFTSISTS